MCPLFCLIQFVLCPACYNILLMIQIMCQKLVQVQDLRLVVHKRQHDHAKRILQLCMFVQLVQNDIRVCVASKLDADTHTLSVGFITQIRDTIDSFITNKLCNLFDQTCLIYQKRQLCYDNTVLAVCHRFNIRHSTHTDLTTACAVGLFDTGSTEDLATGREIRTFNDLQ